MLSPILLCSGFKKKIITKLFSHKFLLIITSIILTILSGADFEKYYFYQQQDERISAASWIWYPEKFIDSRQQTRYFQKTISLTKNLKTAFLYVKADDYFKVTVNGLTLQETKLDQSSPYSWANVSTFDLKKNLLIGDNTIIFAVTNGSGPAGLLCRAEIELEDNSLIDIVSDQSWQTSKEIGDEWQKPRFLGDVTAAPWGGADFTPFLTRKELKVYQDREAKKNLQLKKIEKELLQQQKKIPRIAYQRGLPHIVIGDKSFPANMYKNRHLSPDDPRFIRKIDQFSKAGTKFVAIDIDLAKYWTGPDQVRKPDLNRQLLKILAVNQDAHFLIGINLMPPKWWIKDNPEQLIGYASGPALLEERNVFKRFAAPSYASEKWHKECAQVLQKVISHLENIPAGRRIFAYRLDFGIYTEWHYYGMKEEMPDTGPAMTQTFRQWLKQNYQNDNTKLQAAWNDAKVTFENATVPDSKERSTRGMLALREPLSDRKTLDYLLCHQKVLSQCQLFFNKIAKETSKGKTLVGNYSGYFLGMNYPAEGWHLETARILDSPWVDFQVSPYCYSPVFRAFGGSGQIRSVEGAYRLREKLTILEADTRTHLNETNSQHFANNASESIGQLGRDFANALTHGTGVWYYSFGNNWYDDPEIYRFFKQCGKIMALPSDCSSISEVAFVCDFDSVIYHSQAINYSALAHSAINGSIIELAHSGVPYDTVLFSDLNHPDIPDYKVYLFPNLYYLTAEKKHIIDHLKAKGKTLVWLYAPGLISPEGISIRSSSELTGISLSYLPEKGELLTTFSSDEHPLIMGLNKTSMPLQRNFRLNEGPIVFADDAKASKLGFFRHGELSLCSLAMKKIDTFTSIFCGTPFISRKLLRNIFKESGVHLYGNNYEDVIFANKSFIAVHTRSGGKRTIFLPELSTSVSMMLPEEKKIGNQIKEINIDLQPNSTTIFYLQK